MKDIKSVFSVNLRNKLAAKNKTQAQLAKYLGVSQTSVSLWCNGEVLPRSTMINRIADFFMCSADELTTDHSKTVELAPEDVIAEEYKQRSAEIQQKIAEIQKNPPLKTKIFTSNWKELYMELDEVHRRSFWRNIIKKIIVDVEISTFDIIY